MTEGLGRLGLTIKTFARLGIAAVAIAAAVYWLRFAPVSVSTHVITSASIKHEVLGTGTLEARVSTSISPKISGRIERLTVDQGEHVKSGQTLVRMDDDELRQQVAIAEANVEAARAAIERLKSDKSRANVVLTQAQKTFDRVDLLKQRDATSQDDLDQAAEALGVAVADVTRAEAGINEGQKELIAAEENLEFQRARLQDTQIEAPFDGLIVKRDREPGDVVVPGSSILTLISMDQLWISAWVDETEMAKLAEGQDSRVVFRSQPDINFPGKVSRLGREADRETREFIVDVQVLELPKNWAVGQRAEAYVTVAQLADVIVVPQDYIIRHSSGEIGVFIVEDDVARWRPVQLGIRGADGSHVTDGLRAGDVVAKPVNPKGQLRDGQGVVSR